PFTSLYGPRPIQNAAAIRYPDSTGIHWQLPADQQTRTRFFNTDAFVDPNPATGAFRYGTVPRNSLIGPGIISLDASANKRFTVGSKYLEARIEVFNLPNRPIFSQPGNQLRTPNFGVLTSTRLDSRQIQ